ncbi:MAG TPA: hypothetical protein VEY30_05120, partial [Myxococcaceae bacterium]|nr:hypothetical protein [Myxococcaceae bacterium]
EDPAFSLGQAQALARLGRKEDALRALDRLAGAIEEQPALAADALMAQADLAHELGRDREATALLERAAALSPNPAEQRTAQIKLAAQPEYAGAAIWAYFQPGPEDLKLFRLREALDADPQSAPLNYLLGRRLAQRNAPASALLYLNRSLAVPVSEAVRRETLKLKLESEFAAGDCAAVRATAGGLASPDGLLRRRAQEWVERCAFETQAFGRPLVPEAPFR